MSVNRISLDITDAKKAEITSNTSKLADSTKDFNLVISKEEIKPLPKIADARIPFVEKTLQFSISNPEFLPPYANVAEFQKDFTAFKSMREILYPLWQITDNLENSMMVAGSEAWYAALGYYQTVKFNAKMGVPGAQTIYEILRPLFEAKNSPEPDDDNEPKS